jgi:hypothetical protein
MKSKINVSHYEDNELPLPLSLPLLSPPPPPSVQVISPWKVENKKGNAISQTISKSDKDQDEDTADNGTVVVQFARPCHSDRKHCFQRNLPRPLQAVPRCRYRCRCRRHWFQRDLCAQPLVAFAVAISSREISARGPLLPST